MTPAMKKSVLYCLLIMSGMYFASCNSDDGEDNQPITYADIEASFQTIPIETGTQDLKLQITETLFYDFRVIFPDGNLDQGLPLVLALHWANNGDPTTHLETNCYVEPGLESLDAIILSPNSGLTEWGSLDNQDKLRILMDLAMRYWPVDLNRIAVIGYSSGGNGSWFYTETQPQIFSAGIAMASGYNPFRPDMSVRVLQNPMYVIHGDADDFFPIDTVQNWVNASRLAGSNIEFVVAPGLGHYQPCDYVPYLKEGVNWLINDIWN